MPRHNAPIQPATGFSVVEVLTPGMKLRFQAIGNFSAGPLRKSYNSAAADTHRGGL